MQKLVEFAEKAGVMDRVVKGLSQLVDDDKAIEILQFLENWRVSINRRSTTFHGRCNYEKHLIEIHVHLLSPGSEENRDQVLLHEIAHAVTIKLYKEYMDETGRTKYRRTVKAHGREWKRVMRAFKANPERTANIDTMREFKNSKAKLVYACQRCEQEFPAMRKKKYPAENYSHNGCGGRLYLKENRVTGFKAPKPEISGSNTLTS